VRCPGIERLDAHAGPVPLDLPAVAVRAECRLMAAVAVLWIACRLDGMDGDEIGPMRFRHVLASPREAFLQIGLDAPAVVTVEAEGLLVAIGAVAGGLQRQQPVLAQEKGAVIVRHAGPAMAVPAVLQLGVLVFPVIRRGERDTDDHKEKGRGQRCDFPCPTV